MTKAAIISARIAELTKMIADLHASQRRLEIEKAIVGLQRAKVEARQQN